jgi:hypothetical protein
MRFNKTAIIEALERLARRDPKCKLFGSASHEYRLNSPLPVKRIEAFERKHRVTLPKDYKYFITAVGNGGAGPYYGLFRFGEHDDLHDFCKWKDGGLVGDLSKKFSHTKAWNLPRSFFRAEELEPRPDASPEEEEQLYEEWNKRLEEHYWNPAIMNGAIPICHLGCAYRHWLVINGKQRGFVWGDRADEKGIYPLRTSSRRPVTFADWYLSWLRDPRKTMKLKA